jgi:uncharacterized protein (TIGR00269 family)
VKCRRCREGAVIELRRHNAAFCSPCFVRYCQEQVRKAIDEFDMIGPADRVLVCISGGKDSLGLWDLLLDMGYQADGLYLGLGIGNDLEAGERGAGYSKTSGDYARAFAARRGVHLIEVDLPETFGYDIATGAAAARRAPCSACGLSKRHLFNSVAIEHGYDAVATGHNLDDEAAVLFGNTLRWNVEFLGRQLPTLPAGNGFVRKVKPLVRLSEYELAAYCVLRGIDYIVEECPMADGNRHIGYKEALNAIEEQSPGSKHAFYFEFLAKASELFQPAAMAERDAELRPCGSCGSPTTGDTCAFCALVARATDPERVVSAKVHLGRTRRRAGRAR